MSNGAGSAGAAPVDAAAVLDALAATLEARKGADPSASYVAHLYSKGSATICKKLGEEAAEAVFAAAREDREALVAEVADLWFHSLVLLAHEGLSPHDVTRELARRLGTGGHAEKRSRTRSVKVSK